MSPIDDYDDEVQAALRRSLEAGSETLIPLGRSAGLERRGSSPVAKRSKSEEEREASANASQRQRPPMASSSGSALLEAGTPLEDEAARERRKQREIRAAAAEKRMQSLQKGKKPVRYTLSQCITSDPAKPQLSHEGLPTAGTGLVDDPMVGVTIRKDSASNPAADIKEDSLSQQQSEAQDQVTSLKPGGTFCEEAPTLFNIVFGSNPPPQTLSQWTNQGFRFSEDAETSLGLVQKEGGPCGVLAPVQALVVKHLLFADTLTETGGNLRERETLVFTPEQSQRALVSAMAETLWVAGGGCKAALALVDPEATPALQALTSGEGLKKVLKVVEYRSLEGLRKGIQHWMHVFQSGVGALLMLFSVLLSRSLMQTQADRDDPSLPLVTEPFGHASQEIVNLLVCGYAVPNVFDGVMDLGAGMSLKGIPDQADVGFLTLLESLNLCKVGENLKRPRLPIWVVGSESHYTVLFALDKGVQEEDTVEEREEKKVREAFDRLDTSGGGGFITPEALDQLSAELLFELPANVKEEIGGGMGVIVWQELWKALLKLETSKGGMKHIAEAAGSASQKERRFYLYHFNGIAKRVLNPSNFRSTAAASTLPNGNANSNEQRPRLTRIRVSVPPKWTPNECMAIQPYTVSDLNLTMAPAADSHSTPTAVDNQHPLDSSTSPSTLHTSGPADVCESTVDVSMFDKAQYAPLADCIRTRWPRATCGWEGDAPSIV